jgi:hypothetical protein
LDPRASIEPEVARWWDLIVIPDGSFGKWTRGTASGTTRSWLAMVEFIVWIEIPKPLKKSWLGEAFRLLPRIA